MHVTKRSGEKEEFSVEKIHKVVQWATKGINGVSFSDICMNANLSIYDGISSSEIHQVLIKSANDLISESNPNYQYVAARLLNMQLRKKVWGCGDQPTDFLLFLQRNVDNGMYDPSLLEKWSTKERTQVHPQMLVKLMQSSKAQKLLFTKRKIKVLHKRKTKPLRIMVTMMKIVENFL